MNVGQPSLITRPWRDLYHAVPHTIEPESQTGLDMFRATAARRGGAPLVHYFDRSFSTEQVDRCRMRLRWRCRAAACAPAIAWRCISRTSRRCSLTVLAVWKCGAAVVPCNPMLRERELVKILGDSGSRVLICQDDLYSDIVRAALSTINVRHTITTSALDYPDAGTPVPGVLAALRPTRHAGVMDLRELLTQHDGQRPAPVPITGDDVAFLVYTSGTTGEPKAATNTHRNVVFATSVYQKWIGFTDADAILGLAPLFHVTGLIGHVALAMLTGCPLVLFYRFDAEEACRLTELHRATFTVSAVTAFIALLNSGAMSRHDLSSLVKVYTGGAPTPPSVLAEWHAGTGTRIQPMYGLTEATSPTHMTPPGVVAPIDPRSGVMSMGVPVFNTDVRIVTESGHDAEPREIGELVITGPQIVPGYWRKPRETAAALPEGALRTGDVGFMDEQGWFYLVDRKKDMIVASGFKVWPREVEEVLYLHPAVREAAVVGIPDEYRGETIKAVISLKPGYEVTPEEIKGFARTQLAAYKYPRVVEIVDDLPKTTSGKIMRRMLQPARMPVAPVATPRSVAVEEQPELLAAG